MSGPFVPVLIILFLIFLNALFAGTEIAVLSMREGQLQRVQAKGERGRRLAALARDQTRFLSTIQVGINIVATLSAIVTSRSLTESLADALSFAGRAADGLAIGLTTIVLTYVTIVLGELVPKRLAVQRAESWGLRAAGPVSVVEKVTRPLVWLLGRSTDVVVRLLGFDPHARQEEVSEEEVRDIIATQIDVSPQQRDILAGAFEVAERTLREIVVPRGQLTVLAAEMTAEEGLAVLAASGHTRAPVYAGDLDHVTGVVHLLDLLGEDGTVADHVRPVVVLPETVGVLDALRQLQAEHQQLTVVVNEHGGTEGIVTLEDLLEEIVGELYDEFDPDLRQAVRDEAGSLVVPGDYPVHDLPDIGVNLPEGPYATVAGYALSRLGAIPTGGEVVEDDGWRLEVEEVSGRAIKRLRLTPLETADSDPEPGRHRQD